MDFHSLSRRDLQSLCKKNFIPANMSNIAMADSLQSLQSVEGIDEIQEALHFQSPKKPNLVSPAALPRTVRRTASRKVGPAGQEEPKEQQASPLPRARRVNARVSEILNLMTDEVKEGAKKDAPETPKVPNTRRRTIKKEEGVAETPTGQKTVTTRRRATKKEESKEVVETPATRNGRRASALRAAEAQKEEKPMGVTSRQSTKKEVGEVSAMGADLLSGGLRRSMRVRGRGAAIDMASLATEEEEKEKQEKEAKDSVKNDLCPEEKADDKSEQEEKGEIKDTEEEKIKSLGNTADLCYNEQQDLVTRCSDEAIQKVLISADLNTEEKQDKSSEQSSGLEGNTSENNQNQEEEKDQQEHHLDDALPGFEGSPISGLISSNQDSNQQQNPSAEIESVERLSVKENETPTGDGDFKLQEPPFYDETPAEKKDSSEGPVKQTDDNDNRDDPTIDTSFDKITAEIPTESADSSEDDSAIMEKREKNVGDNDLNGETEVETMESEITIESPAKTAEDEDFGIKSLEKQPTGDDLTIKLGSDKDTADVTAESCDDDDEITEKCEESDGEKGANLTVEIPAEIDNPDDDLSSNVVTGEISVEPIEEQKSLSAQTDIARESLDELGQLIDDLSDLNISSKYETKATEMEGQKLPAVAGTYREETDNKENSGLVALTPMELGPIGGGAKMRFKGEKQNHVSMSLRKLKAVYKETLVTMNNKKGEEQRAALKAIDENCS